MNQITISLPVYYTIEYKKPKTTKVKQKDGRYKIKTIDSRTFLVALNWYRNENPFTLDDVKQHYHKLVLEALQSKNFVIPDKYSTSYKYCYKSSVSDAGNVISIIEKYVLDGLKECGVITDDSVKYHIRSDGWTIEEDKTNPRLEITIKAI